jgi:hypothetical protein
MYIHKDGKTNIIDKDGLLLYDKDNKVDVILTNPPLGDLNYQVDTYDNNFKLKRMEVIPKKNLTEEKIKTYEKQILKWRERQAIAQGENKTKVIQRCIDRIDELNSKIAECRIKIRDSQSVFSPTGNQMKGGALFINASKYYLKATRDGGALPEWRGGRLLIVIDEGVLNTGDYKEVRAFIKKYFYIKAVVSLTRDTFVPVSSTTTKTSILYAIKKEDPDALQQEPIFFAHAEKVGLDTRKKVCPNHLFNSGNDVLSRYKEFKVKVLESYDGVRFNKQKFLQKGFTNGKIE